MEEKLTASLSLEREDLLGVLQHARRSEDLGRLAKLVDWDVPRWARLARNDALAALAAEFVARRPFASREDFLATVDTLIAELHGTCDAARSGGLVSAAACP